MKFDKLKQFMDDLCANVIPGNGISVFIDSQNVFHYAAGYSSIENKTPMTCDDLIYIYSCSKLVTMVAILQLLERKLISVDDYLYQYIPEYQQMYVFDENNKIQKAKNHIKIMHLINMTAGVSYDRNRPFLSKAKQLTNDNMDTIQVMKCLAEEPLSFEPGTHWQYGLCHDILAAVVEVVTKKKFSEYVKENIFIPLQMNNSFYHKDQNLLAEQYIFVENSNTNQDDLVIAQRSTSSFDGIVVNAGKNNDLIFGPSYDSGGAGIISTVNDYVKLCCALANHGVGLNGNKILNDSSIELMKTNTLNEIQLKDFNWEQLKGYGYGYGVRTLLDKEKSHSTGNLQEFGWGGAAGATILIDTSINLAVFYAHHMLNPLESYYQPKLRNIIYDCIHDNDK